MKHPNGVIYEYPQGSAWDPLGTTQGPIEVPAKWIPYTKQILIIYNFFRDGATPVILTNITQSGETWTKLTEQSRTFNNSSMYVAAP